MTTKVLDLYREYEYFKKREEVIKSEIDSIRPRSALVIDTCKNIRDVILEIFLILVVFGMIINPISKESVPNQPLGNVTTCGFAYMIVGPLWELCKEASK